jgi:hypothetical protein
MSGKWTALSTAGLLVLAVVSMIAYEATAHPGSEQRERFANAVWPLVGVAALGLWGWHLASGRRR